MMNARIVGYVMATAGVVWFLLCAFSLVSLPDGSEMCGNALMVTASTPPGTPEQVAGCRELAHDRLALGAFPAIVPVILGLWMVDNGSQE